MEALMLLGVFCLAALAAWLPAGSASASVTLEGVRASLARRAVVGRLAVVGSLPVPAALFGFEALHEAQKAMEESEFGRRWELGAEAARSALLLGWLGIVTLGLFVAGAIGALVCGAAAVACVPAWHASRRKRRQEEVARQVPGIFRSLAVALGAGKTLAQAISYVGARGDGTLSREFGRAALKVSCGSSAAEALGELAERTRAPGVDLMVCALVVSARTGAPLQDLFLRSARLAEQRFELQRELLGKTAQVRLSTRIVSALPAGLVGMLALLSPDFREGLGTPVGMGSVCVAALLDVTALLVIRGLMKGVL